MRKTFLLLLILPGLFSAASAQILDTVISTGSGQQLHFTIIKGKGAPVLFESGFGNGGDVWKNITKQIADVTGATVITYDRLSSGNDPKSYRLGFDTEIKALETGLQKLGYAGKAIMLVSHSLGGMYSTYYASRHSTEVKATVFIDVTSVCALASYFKMPGAEQDETERKYLAEMQEICSKNPLPLNIPVMDIVAANHTDDNGNMDTVWLACHKSFVAQSPARKSLFAYGTGHYVFNDNPPLVINAIITQYANFLAPEQKAMILEKGYAQALTMLNESKKNDVKCGHSEDDLTTWGYSLLEKNETEKAIEIFRLNVTLNPEGWNTYDSLAEAYLKAGNKELAIKNYKRSLELNPKNDNAVKVLEKIQK